MEVKHSSLHEERNGVKRIFEDNDRTERPRTVGNWIKLKKFSSRFLTRCRHCHTQVKLTESKGTPVLLSMNNGDKCWHVKRPKIGEKKIKF